MKSGPVVECGILSSIGQGRLKKWTKSFYPQKIHIIIYLFRGQIFCLPSLPEVCLFSSNLLKYVFFDKLEIVTAWNKAQN